LRVVSTHLGLDIGERRQQAGKLLALAQPSGPAVVMGDFNDWFWVSSVRGAFAARFPQRTGHRTFPARLPLMRLDRVYGSNVQIVASFTDRDARAISDHLPVIVDLTWSA
jgi:endonuclease/exonuclease/phosphatase family metal-dependent hydrolase